MAAARFVIKGVVQGVGFRYHTQAKAKELSLTGWVRNLPDGSVESFAQGHSSILGDFEAWLWRGPTASQVVSVDKAPLDEDPSLVDFNITR